MKKEVFENTFFSLLNDNEKILICLRIPNSGNNIHYFFIENRSDFDNLISICNPSDSLTVFKSFNEIYCGLISTNCIRSLLQFVSEKDFLQEVLILESSYQEFKRKGFSEWQGLESISEFREVLTENCGMNRSIILGAELWNTDNTINLYIPNINGFSKPGNSY